MRWFLRLLLYACLICCTRAYRDEHAVSRYTIPPGHAPLSPMGIQPSSDIDKPAMGAGTMEQGASSLPEVHGDFGVQTSEQEEALREDKEFEHIAKIQDELYRKLGGVLPLGDGMRPDNMPEDKMAAMQHQEHDGDRRFPDEEAKHDHYAEKDHGMKKMDEDEGEEEEEVEDHPKRHNSDDNEKRHHDERGENERDDYEPRAPPRKKYRDRDQEDEEEEPDREARERNDNSYKRYKFPSANATELNTNTNTTTQQTNATNTANTTNTTTQQTNATNATNEVNSIGPGETKNETSVSAKENNSTTTPSIQSESKVDAAPAGNATQSNTTKPEVSGKSRRRRTLLKSRGKESKSLKLQSTKHVSGDD